MFKLTAVFMLLPTVALLQPTIQQAHLPQPGHVLTVNLDNQGGAQFIPTAAGAAPQTWNYVNAFGGTTMDQFEFVTPTGLPGAAAFPNATLARPGELIGSQFVSYFSAGPDGFKVEGYYFNEPGSSTVTSTHVNNIQIPVPFTYGTNVNVNAIQTEITITPGQPAERHRRYTERSLIGDAHGTITTPEWPLGVEVVRLRYQEFTTVDSLFLDMSGSGNGPWVFQDVETWESPSVTYNFLRAGAPMFVMDVEDDGSFAAYYGSTVTSVAENRKMPSAQVSPNPTHGPLTIYPNILGVHQIEILDLTGQMIGSYPIQGADRLNVMTDSWSAGPYIYRCLDSNGSAVSHGRFVVVHE